MFKKLQELLEAGIITKEAAEALDGEINTALKSLRDEAASYRVKYQELNSSYQEVLNSKTSLEEQLKSLDERIAKAKEEGKNELVKELESEKAQKDELSKRLNELELKTRGLKIENELNRALSSLEYEPVDSEMVTEYLKSKFVDIVDDKVKFKKGDNLLDLNDGIKSLVQERPNLFKAKGQSGSGAGEHKAGGFNPKNATDEEIADFISKNGVEALAKIKE